MPSGSAGSTSLLRFIFATDCFEVHPNVAEIAGLVAEATTAGETAFGSAGVAEGIDTFLLGFLGLTIISPPRRFSFSGALSP